MVKNDANILKIWCVLYINIVDIFIEHTTYFLPAMQQYGPKNNP